jgi:hypothetical protein
MTIPEHLQLSVLTAPIATLDRRTLSQAWYSALYGNREAAQKSANVARSQSLPAAPVHIPLRSAVHGDATHETAAARKLTMPSNAPNARGGEIERRAPRSPLARKIERAFLHPRKMPRKATFSLEGEHGRVQVMLRSHGSQVKLVAICAPKAKAHVAHALAQARYTLALRGIDVDVDMRERAAC